MNKHQVVWLIIRLIGVYFVYLAVASVFGLIATASVFFTLPYQDLDLKKNSNANIQPTAVQPVLPRNLNLETESPKKTEAETAADIGKRDAFKLLLWYVFVTAVYGLIGWYLIKDGRILFALLNREEPNKAANEENKEVTTLNLSDRQN